MSNIYRRIMLSQVTPTFMTKAVAGVFKPGYILAYNGAAVDAVIAHSVAGGTVGPLMVAEIDYGNGKGLRDDNGEIEAYAVGNQVNLFTPRAGDRFVGHINNGVAVLAGGYVMSAGNGKLTPFEAQTITIPDLQAILATATWNSDGTVSFTGDSSGIYPAGLTLTVIPNRIVGIALDSVDMSSSSAADPDGLCKIEAI